MRARVPLKDYEEFKRRKREQYWDNPGRFRKEAHAWRQKWLNDDLRREVLTHYGRGTARCAWCKHEDLAALTLDHVTGGGGKQRKALNRSGKSFYRWLRQNDFPAGFQVL